MTAFHAKTVYGPFTGTAPTVSSATYIDLLITNGGSPWQISFPKSAGTSLLVTMASACRAASGNTTVTVGVNDGTTDYDAAVTQCFVTGSRRVTFDGAVMIPASAAGTITLTARAKISGTSVSFSTVESFSMSVFECNATGFPNAVCTYQSMATGMSGTFASYTDVKDGATPISAVLTKADAANKILYHGRLSTSASAANTVFQGVNDGTSDFDVSSGITPNGGYWTNNSGERLLTGHAAGNVTLKPRVKCASSISVGNSVAVWAIEVPP